MNAKYDQAVREQYERYPYPPRDPEREKSELLVTWLDGLAQINFHCYKGKNDFQNHFRVLVAGGGTGDSVIYLAEQLRETNAELVYLDISSNSMAVAKKRAEIRGLKNITWLQNSVLDLSQLRIGKFDYINCSGVLHHLNNPDAGLESLKAVLKSDGAIAIMVYGKYGRTGVYQIQELMRLINQAEANLEEKVQNTKTILNCLPRTNWWKRGEDLFSEQQLYGDAGVCDIFLHSCDRAYSVSELYSWIRDRSGLNVKLCHVLSGRQPYMPESYITDPKVLRKIKGLPQRDQEAVAELLSGTIKQHCLYASRLGNTSADLMDLDNVPFFFNSAMTGSDIVSYIENAPDRSIIFENKASGVRSECMPGQYTRSIFKYIDGQRSLKDIFIMVRDDTKSENGPTDETLLEDFRPIFESLQSTEGMLLRHKAVGRFKTVMELQSRFTQDLRSKS